MTEKDLLALFAKSDELSVRPGLKNEILQRAEAEMAAREAASAKKKRGNFPLKRWIALAACFLVAVLLGGAIWGLQIESYRTVYIDVNPSVALVLNRFGTVNDVQYQNADAARVLGSLALEGESAEDALESVMLACSSAGYFDEEATVYISMEGPDDGQLLESLENRAKQASIPPRSGKVPRKAAFLPANTV